MRSNLIKLALLATSLAIGSGAHAAPSAAAPVPRAAAPATAGAAREPMGTTAPAAPRIEGGARAAGVGAHPGAAANPVVGNAIGGSYVPNIVPPAAGTSNNPAYCNVPAPPPSCNQAP